MPGWRMKAEEIKKNRKKKNKKKNVLWPTQQISMGPHTLVYQGLEGSLEQ